VVRNGKGKRPEGYVEPPLEELAKLRRCKEEEAPASEEANLAAALEAAFARREEKQSKPAEPKPDFQQEIAKQEKQNNEEADRANRSRSRNRRRRSRAVAENKAAAATEKQVKDTREQVTKQKPAPKANEGGEKPAAPAGEKKPHRRRRPRGGKPAAGKQEG